MKPKSGRLTRSRATSAECCYALSGRKDARHAQRSERDAVDRQTLRDNLVAAKCRGVALGRRKADRRRLNQMQLPMIRTARPPQLFDAGPRQQRSRPRRRTLWLAGSGAGKSRLGHLQTARPTGLGSN